MIRLLVIAAALALPLTAHAQPAASSPAGMGFRVMDGDRLATEAAAMRSMLGQMARRRDVEATAYNMALDKLDAEFEPVRKAQATMDPAEYQKAVERYDAVKAQIDGVLSKVQQEMNAAGEKAVTSFNATVASVSDELRRELGVARFVDGAAVLYVRPGSGYDVTDEVIRRVNARLPDIKVAFPERQKPAEAAGKPAKPANKR